MTQITPNCGQAQKRLYIDAHETSQRAKPRCRTPASCISARRDHTKLEPALGAQWLNLPADYLPEPFKSNPT